MDKLFGKKPTVKEQIRGKSTRHPPLPHPIEPVAGAWIFFTGLGSNRKIQCCGAGGAEIIWDLELEPEPKVPIFAVNIHLS